MQPSDVRDSMRGFNKQPSYSTISVRVKNPKQVEAVEQAIKKLGFNTFSILDATRSLRQFFAVLDLFLGIFGSLALAVASIGIVNTLVMAILERRREIGIMKAIGASDSDVKKLFFAEAGAMGLLGGVVGVALGWTIGHIINLGTNIYLKRQALPPESSLVGAMVAGGSGHRFCLHRQPGFRPVPGCARGTSIPCRRFVTSKSFAHFASPLRPLRLSFESREPINHPAPISQMIFLIPHLLPCLNTRKAVPTATSSTVASSNRRSTTVCSCPWL